MSPKISDAKAVIVVEWHAKNNYARSAEAAFERSPQGWLPLWYDRCDTRSGKGSDIPLRDPYLWARYERFHSREPDFTWSLSVMRRYDIPPDETLIVFNNAVRQCVACGRTIIQDDILKSREYSDAICDLWGSAVAARETARKPVDLTSVISGGYQSPLTLFLCDSCKGFAKQITPRGALTWKSIVRYAAFRPFPGHLTQQLAEDFKKTWPEQGPDGKKRAAARRVRRLVRARKWPEITPSTRRFFQLIIGAKNLEKLTSKIPA